MCIRDRLNALFKNHSIRKLIQTGKLSFCYHAHIMDGRMGKKYKEGYVDWMQNGAIAQLTDMLDKDSTSEIPQFVSGPFGSVSCYVNLTGGSLDRCRTKKARIVPLPMLNDTWHMMVDASWDEKW